MIDNTQFGWLDFFLDEAMAANRRLSPFIEFYLWLLVFGDLFTFL